MYNKLFTPIRINTMMARNRIVATPTGDEFEEKALGGAGIVICGHTIVDFGRSSFASPNEQYLFSKYSVEGARSRIRKCHQVGAKASIELFHAGLYARVKDYALGPCGFIREDGIEVKEMDEAMMLEVANMFADAAKDAKNLGFDMIFMHFGHGWLPAQFLSPLFNHRNDEYGGSIENRIKFPKLILEKVREAVGPYYPVDMRISAVEHIEGSIEFKDTLYFIKSVEHLIDTVQISSGLDINHEANVHMVTTNFSDRLVNVKYAQEVKKNINIPVSVVGAILNPEDANRLIEEGRVDLVGIGRAFLADPDWANKAKENRGEDIVPCIRCLQCYHISTNRRNVGCSVNPRYKNEDFVLKDVTKAEIKKKIAIIGAGPSGIIAAITASKRGHDVTLFEKDSGVGGQLKYIVKEKYKEDIKKYFEYLKVQLKKSEVKVVLNTEVNKELIERFNPDSIIVAVGSDSIIPRIDGIDRKNVIGFHDALIKPEIIKDNVIIIGGGTIGAELGLELAEENKSVHIIEMSDTLALQANMLYKIALRQKVEKLENLKIHFNSQVTKICEDKVIVIDSNNKESEISGDTIIIATGVKPKKDVAESFYGINRDVYLIGDCNSPRIIMDAVFEGYTIASRI